MEKEKEVYRQTQNDILIPALDKLSTTRGDLADLAKRLESNFGMRHAKNRLSELRSGKRTLSYYFLQLMIDGGVMTVKQILRGRGMDELTGEERDIVLRLTADREILQLLYEAQQEGLDVKTLLKISLKK